MHIRELKSLCCERKNLRVLTDRLASRSLSQLRSVKPWSALATASPACLVLGRPRSVPGFPWTPLSPSGPSQRYLRCLALQVGTPPYRREAFGFLSGRRPHTERSWDCFPPLPLGILRGI